MEVLGKCSLAFAICDLVNPDFGFLRVLFI
jgi:hypothetical protein